MHKQWMQGLLVGALAWSAADFAIAEAPEPPLSPAPLMVFPLPTEIGESESLGQQVLKADPIQVVGPTKVIELPIRVIPVAAEEKVAVEDGSIMQRIFGRRASTPTAPQSTSTREPARQVVTPRSALAPQVAPPQVTVSKKSTGLFPKLPWMNSAPPTTNTPNRQQPVTAAKPTAPAATVVARPLPKLPAPQPSQIAFGSMPAVAAKPASTKSAAEAPVPVAINPDQLPGLKSAGEDRLVAAGAPLKIQAPTSAMALPKEIDGVPVVVGEPEELVSVQAVPGPVAATTEPPSLPPAATPDTSVDSSAPIANGQYAHAADYSWLQGQLLRVHGKGGTWILRYAPLDVEDKFGGRVNLGNDSKIENLKDGDYIMIRGELIDEIASAKAFGGPQYRVKEVEPVLRVPHMPGQ